MTSALNIITRIAVRIVSTSEMCHKINIDLDQCSVTIDDGSPITTDGNYTVGDQTTVSKIDNSSIFIRVPNCGSPIELRVECEVRRVFDPETLEHRDIEMLKLSITRRLFAMGLTVNGIIGKFSE